MGAFRDRLRPIAVAAGYSLWFSLLLNVFVWVTFPWSRARDLLVVEAADRGMALDAASLRVSPWGATLRDVALGKGPDGSGEPKKPWFRAEKLRLRASALKLLSAARKVRAARESGDAADLGRKVIETVGSMSIAAKLTGGDVELRADHDGTDGIAVDLTGEALDLAGIAVRTAKFEADPTGKLRAVMDVDWNLADVRKSQGTVDLTATALRLAGLKVSGMALPETIFEKAEVHLKIAQGRAELRDSLFEGDVFSAGLEGFIRLDKNPLHSTLSLRVKFKVREDLEDLLSIAGLRKTSSNRDDEGWYHYQGTGRITSPRFRERSVAAAKGQAHRTYPKDDDVGPGDFGGEFDPGGANPVERSTVTDDRRAEIEEERQRLRDERVARREERQRKRQELMEARRKRQEDARANGEDFGKEPMYPGREPVEPAFEPEDVRTNEPEPVPEPEYHEEDVPLDPEVDEGQ